MVQSQKFSEKITQLMNAYYNGLITNEEVIKELLEAAAIFFSFIFAISSSISGSVSYTHLDVYKRQGRGGQARD